MPQLAIVGAGVAGLAAARALHHRRPQLSITLYEQSDRPGGRVATRRRDAYIFDHGAQNLRAPTPELLRLLTVDLPAGDLHDIGLPVWTFDGAGAIAPGDPAQNAEPKWIYRSGLDQLGELLGAGLDIRCGVPIASLWRTADIASGQGAAERQWSLLGGGEQVVGSADLVLLTPPAPHAARIVAASSFDVRVKDSLVAELSQASYRRCISLAIAYPRPIERPFYALVNTDRSHPIAWLALEHAKAPERCPPGHSLLIAQMGARWSLEQWDAPHEQLERLIVPLVARLLGEDLGAPIWSDAERWPEALPDRGADFAALNSSGAGLFFAGDYTAGLGRVHLAIESGWRAAELIERAL